MRDTKALVAAVIIAVVVVAFLYYHFLMEEGVSKFEVIVTPSSVHTNDWVTFELHVTNMESGTMTILDYSYEAYKNGHPGGYFGSTDISDFITTSIPSGETVVAYVFTGQLGAADIGTWRLDATLATNYGPFEDTVFLEVLA